MAKKKHWTQTRKGKMILEERSQKLASAKREDRIEITPAPTIEGLSREIADLNKRISAAAATMSTLLSRK